VYCKGNILVASLQKETSETLLSWGSKQTRVQH